MTSNRAKEFQTPLGRFCYTPVNPSVFPIGLTLQVASGSHFLLAEPEKALCDRLAKIPNLTSIREIEIALEQDLRVEVGDIIAGFRLPLVQEIASAYRRKSVTAFAQWLTKARQSNV